MATRTAVRYISRRFSSGSGKVLGTQARGETWFRFRGTAADANPSGTTSTSGASAEKASSDKFRNYGVVAGVATLGVALDGISILKIRSKKSVSEVNVTGFWYEVTLMPCGVQKNKANFVSSLRCASGNNCV
ncbi:hypothetical protein F3Y22_tig00110882pilonHSYRG00066 [Hibiscus syriacus]|uniref:Uncharacterized protein n=1 Tax=Hibiscus syriacus TaxID=106335 RepID=A0A6A2ZI77_HIBSY|nr:hypothetical protein F3Y22_tig00110882pilonHSYRG00066 [Hibiscus syriacus]